jgi:hypothetical protein
MNRKEWKIITRQKTNCPKGLWSAYWSCRRYWQPVIEKMIKVRPNMSIVIHHELCRYNDEHYEEWSVDHTIPMYRDEHTKYHSGNPEWNKNRIEAIQKAMSDPKVKEKISASAKYSHSQPNYLEKQKNSKLALMKDIKFKEKHRVATKAAMNRPETLEKVKLARLKAMSNLETIEKIRSSLKVTNSLPETEKHRSDAMNRVETKRKQIAGIKASRLKEFGISAFGITDTMLGWANHTNISFSTLRYHIKNKKENLDLILLSQGFTKEKCTELYNITP